MRSTCGCGLGVVLLLSACTRPNPGFEGGESEGSGVDTADGGRTTGGVSTTGAGSATESGTATDASVDGVSEAEVGSVTDTGLASSGQVDTGPVCDVPLTERYDIVSEPPLESVIGGCPGVGTLYIQNQGLAGNMLTGALCFPNCTCGEDSITLTFEGPPPAALPGCVMLDVELEEVEGSCVVAAYQMRPYMSEAPVLIASNVASPMFPHPFPVELAEAPVVPCSGDECIPASGQYDLVTLEDEPIPHDGTPTFVHADGFDFRVVNDGSAIDPECAPQVRWFAERD